MIRVEHIGDCTLYLGDCLEIMTTLKPVDAVVTDPPYGVMLGEVKNGQAITRGQQPYLSFSDTPKYIEDVCVKVIKAAIQWADRVVLTPGNRCMFLYPQPDDFGVWYNPAGASFGKWGYLLAQPILYYGKDPRRGKCAFASSIWGLNSGDVGIIKNKKHPCPKPLAFTKWLVHKSTTDGETICDPFMGSGTTGIACVEMGRPFIGIEIEEKYFDLSCERIEKAQRQPDMFLKTKIEQLGFFK